MSFIPEALESSTDIWSFSSYLHRHLSEDSENSGDMKPHSVLCMSMPSMTFN